MSKSISFLVLVIGFIATQGFALAGSSDNGQLSESDSTNQACLVHVECQRVIDTHHRGFGCSSNIEGDSSKFSAALAEAASSHSLSGSSDISSTSSGFAYFSPSESYNTYGSNSGDDTAEAETVLKSFPNLIRLTLVYRTNGERKTLTKDWVASDPGISGSSGGGPGPSCLDEAISTVHYWKDQMSGLEQSCERTKESYDRIMVPCSPAVSTDGSSN